MTRSSECFCPVCGEKYTYPPTHECPGEATMRDLVKEWEMLRLTPHIAIRTWGDRAVAEIKRLKRELMAEENDHDSDYAEVCKENDALRAALRPFAKGPCDRLLHDDGKTVKCEYDLCAVCRARALLDGGTDG